MAQLAGTVLWGAIRHPRGYWADLREQMYTLLKRCWLPLVISTTAMGFGAAGLAPGTMMALLGIPERLGAFDLMASLREFAPWINAMVVAGVVGTSMTADLGSRRIREELDAMQVLGVDVIRILVLPRILAVTVMTGLLDLFALTFGVFGGFLASVAVFGASPGAYFGSFFANATVIDLWGSVVKSLFFGLIIGVVCCYKGLRAQGGPMGVGRAVNQAVVISFAAIWIINSLFISILLGLNPDMQTVR